MKRLILPILMMCWLSATAQAQNGATGALINQQLDKLTKLNLSGNLPDVMNQIAKQTGVPIEAHPAVWDLLPWGRETTVNAKIENQTLREALDAITKKLGLVYELKSEALELQPMPALRRLGRRSTVTELDALFILSSTPLQLATEKPKFSELIEAIDLKMEAAKIPFSIENRSSTSASNPVPQDTVLSIPRNATFADALEAMNRQTTATWYPWEKTIVILTKQDKTRRLLKKEVTLRHEGTDVAQVLTELSDRCGVKFRFEPGALQEIPPSSRNIKLVISATAADALEAISGLTGLGYVVKDDEVYVWNNTATTANQRDRVIAFITTETGMQILLTESQTPADVKQYIDFQKKKQIDAIRKMMQEQGFKPTTQPTTKPTPMPRDL